MTISPPDDPALRIIEALKHLPGHDQSTHAHGGVSYPRGRNQASSAPARNGKEAQPTGDGITLPDEWLTPDQLEKEMERLDEYIRKILKREGAKHLPGQHDQSMHGHGAGLTQSVLDFEESIRHAPVEHAAIFDLRDGSVVGEPAVGDKESATFSDETLIEMGKRLGHGEEVYFFPARSPRDFDRMKSLVLTHNHPEDLGPSSMDVLFAHQFGISRVRVVTGKHTYEVELTPKTKRRTDIHDFRLSLKKAYVVNGEINREAVDGIWRMLEGRGWVRYRVHPYSGAGGKKAKELEPRRGGGFTLPEKWFGPGPEFDQEMQRLEDYIRKLLERSAQKSSTSKRSALKRLVDVFAGAKHLPGQHDQSTHGRHGVPQAVLDFESRIRNDTIEHVGVFDERGNMLGSESVGDEGSVSWSRDTLRALLERGEADKLTLSEELNIRLEGPVPSRFIRRNRGVTVTHNHPIDVGPSNTDVITIRKLGIGRLRAVTRGHTYEVELPKAAMELDGTLFKMYLSSAFMQAGDRYPGLSQQRQRVDETWRLLDEHGWVKYKVTPHKASGEGGKEAATVRGGDITIPDEWLPTERLDEEMRRFTAMLFGEGAKHLPGQHDQSTHGRSMAAVRDFEDEHRHNDYESAAFFDLRGNRIGSISRGSSSRCPIDSATLSAVKGQGVIMTHNHPMSGGDEDHLPPSGTDLQVGLNLGCRGVRAVTSKWTYEVDFDTGRLQSQRKGSHLYHQDYINSVMDLYHDLYNTGWERHSDEAHEDERKGSLRTKGTIGHEIMMELDKRGYIKYRATPFRGSRGSKQRKGSEEREGPAEGGIEIDFDLGDLHYIDRRADYERISRYIEKIVPEREGEGEKHLPGQHDQSAHGRGVGPVPKAVTDFEERVRDAPVEHVAVFDREGRQIGSEGVGDAERVVWPDDTVDVLVNRRGLESFILEGGTPPAPERLFLNNRDVIATHNHPNTASAPELNDLGPSTMDVLAAHRLGIGRIRAVTENYTYDLVLTKKALLEPSITFLKAILAHADEVVRDTERETVDENWRLVAADGWVKYHVSERRGRSRVGAREVSAAATSGGIALPDNKRLSREQLEEEMKRLDEYLQGFAKRGAKEEDESPWALDHEMRTREVTESVYVALQAAKKLLFSAMGLKHLVGKHDQLTHGRAGPGGFRASDYRGLSIPERKAKFNALSIEDQDRQADAANTIQKAINEHLECLGPRPTTLNPTDAVRERMAQIEEAGIVTPAAARMIRQHSEVIARSMLGEGEDQRDLALDMVDHLAAQEVEAMGRVMGDHGVRHLNQDGVYASELLKVMPGYDDPRARALVMMAGALHDTGYLTPPARQWADEAHKRWSRQHYDANLKDRVGRVFGKDAAEKLGHIIETHDDTSFNWQDHPVSTAFRLSDNLALFHPEKMPGIIKYVPRNMSALEDYAKGRASLSDTAQAMRRNIMSQAGLTPRQRRALLRAVPDFETAGESFIKVVLPMAGGSLDRFEWRGDHPRVYLRATPKGKELHKFLDLGKRQFERLVKHYKADPASFWEHSHVALEDERGTHLEFQLEGFKHGENGAAPQMGDMMRLMQSMHSMLLQFTAEKAVTDYLSGLLDPNVWEAAKSQWTAQMLDEVTDLLTDGALQAEAFGLAMDFTQVDDTVVAFARQYTSETWDALGASTRERMRRDIVSSVEKGESREQLEERLSRYFDRKRAETIASTEVTRLFAEGNRIGYDIAGVRLVEWRTVRDMRVEDICRGLDRLRQPVDNMVRVPPAHTRCRCYLAPVAADEEFSSPTPKQREEYHLRRMGIEPWLRELEKAPQSYAQMAPISRFVYNPEYIYNRRGEVVYTIPGKFAVVSAEALRKLMDTAAKIYEKYAGWTQFRRFNDAARRVLGLDGRVKDAARHILAGLREGVRPYDARAAETLLKVAQKSRQVGWPLYKGFMVPANEMPLWRRKLRVGAEIDIPVDAFTSDEEMAQRLTFEFEFPPVPEPPTGILLRIERTNGVPLTFLSNPRVRTPAPEITDYTLVSGRYRVTKVDVEEFDGPFPRRVQVGYRTEVDAAHLAATGETREIQVPVYKRTVPEEEPTKIYRRYIVTLRKVADFDLDVIEGQKAALVRYRGDPVVDRYIDISITALVEQLLSLGVPLSDITHVIISDEQDPFHIEVGERALAALEEYVLWRREHQNGKAVGRWLSG